jgi:hypothetical protein
MWMRDEGKLPLCYRRKETQVRQQHRTTPVEREVEGIEERAPDGAASMLCAPDALTEPIARGA